MEAYLLISTIIFLILGIFWNKSSFLNTLIKILLIGMGIVGIILFMQLKGLIIKV